MGREINASAENHLEPGDAVDANQTALAVLVAAFETRQAQVGGEAVMLDTVVEIARTHGYDGTVDQAGSILRREGGFLVERGPSGRLTVRRADLPRP
jgi:hypothetical protein